MHFCIDFFSNEKNKSSFDNPVVLSPLNLNQVLLWAVLPFLQTVMEHGATNGT
jgi:hypothetical protein